MKKFLVKAAAIFLIAMPASWGQSLVDLADKPLSSGSSGEVKPNVMLILDDSGSMDWLYMPDHTSAFGSSKVGQRSPACNAVYYNPSTTYDPPVYADGTSYPDADFKNAKNDGFSTSSGTTDLSKNFKASASGATAESAHYYQYNGPLTPMAYTYKTDGNVNETTGDVKSNLWKACNQSLSDAVKTCDTSKGCFTKVVINNSSPAAVKTNFANWYSYYRKRIMSAKTAVGHAFSRLTNPESYRIGYTTHSYTGTNTTSDSFLNIDDFCDVDDGTGAPCDQRKEFYKKLYKAGASGGTPIRQALSKVGRIYAGKITGAADPVQYSCQQNFTILTTDGFWNGDGGVKMDGSSIGNHDGGSTPRPMYDGNSASGSLADVAMYYYETDLRTNCSTGDERCENNVPATGRDTATHQHMTTFTLGLGVNGLLNYCEDYDKGTCSDFEAIRNGSKNWPKPAADKPTAVDDLWHAAVNGRGKYFSAQSPQAMAAGLQKALGGVSARLASAAAAATSNLEPVAGDNYAYVAKYTTVDWDGDISARQIDLNTGEISNTDIWSAQTGLDTRNVSTNPRKIYFNSGGSLADFTSTNLGSFMTAGVFKPGPDNPSGQPLSHYVNELTTTEQGLATQDSIIDYIRGGVGPKDPGDPSSEYIYRNRKHVLGDIVNAAPTYVKKPPFQYDKRTFDATYSDFVDENKNRKSAVYAGANDGMLHAFNGETGEELWAFIPTAVIPNLYRLADRYYETRHQFYVDGPITIGDFCPKTTGCTKDEWKTILVGGLGKGGRAYFALDVTDPDAPELLWEFSDTNLGYSYGNAVITKLANSEQWVVLVASGYNNLSPGDGKGRLYVINAADGSKIAEIITDNAVTDPQESGIGKINNWVDATMEDNRTRHVYGGDLNGNLWRFDITTNTVVKITTIGQVKDAPTQPITIKPELGQIKIDGKRTRVVMFGTGKYFGMSDIGTTDRMSVYVVKDDLTSPPYGMFRTHANVIEQDLTGAVGSRGISYTAMPTGAIGWYMDLDVEDGERVNVDPKYQLGWLALPGNIPNPNACNVGGNSWLYYIDPWPRKDKEAESGQIFNIGNSLVVGINIVRLPNGKLVTIVTTSDAKYPVLDNPSGGAADQVRRVYWREMTK